VEVVVLGAGPAGCSTSIECAKHGISTLLIDPLRLPERLPGETLHPAASVIFQELGVLDDIERAGFLRHEGHWSGAPESVVWQPYGSDLRGQWLSYQALRPALDLILRRGAQRAGVVFDQESRPAGVIEDNGTVVGIRTGQGDNPIYCRFVVDATGRSRWLARKLKLRTIQASPRLVARFGWNPRSSGHELPRFLPEPNGYLWTAPVTQEETAWTQLKFLSDSARAKGKCRDVTWTLVIPSAGPGYFLTGDAASTLDPALSRGVLNAMMSGMVAGRAIADVICGRGDTRSRLTGYSAWIRDTFCQDAEALLAMYSQFSIPPSWVESSRETLSEIRRMPCSR